MMQLIFKIFYYQKLIARTHNEENFNALCEFAVVRHLSQLVAMIVISKLITSHYVCNS